MPEGPECERCPADAIGGVVRVMWIAMGEEPEDLEQLDGKDAAVAMCGKGDRAKAKELSRKQRIDAIRKGANTRRKMRKMRTAIIK